MKGQNNGTSVGINDHVQVMTECDVGQRISQFNSKNIKIKKWRKIKNNDWMINNSRFMMHILQF